MFWHHLLTKLRISKIEVFGGANKTEGKNLGERKVTTMADVYEGRRTFRD
jgi:hypothetical protein